MKIKKDSETSYKVGDKVVFYEDCKPICAEIFVPVTKFLSFKWFLQFLFKKINSVFTIKKQAH